MRLQPEKNPQSNSGQSNNLPPKREAFRQVNYLHDIALESIVGQGARGYHLALESIARRGGGTDG